MVRSTKLLLVINLIMFIGLRIVVAFGGAIDLFGFSMSHPWFWTPVTYMFTQGSIIELLFNMLWLWCFCRLFMIAGTERRMVVAYVCGGLGGALFFALATLLGLINGGVLLGASAAVISMAVCAAVIAPYVGVELLMIGRVTLKVIAIITVALSLLPFLEHNSGGGWAHIGGAIAGTICGMAMKRGWLPRFSRKSIKTKQEAMTLDSLLDKVRRSGYASLTKAEKRRLIELSNEL